MSGSMMKSLLTLGVLITACSKAPERIALSPVAKKKLLIENARGKASDLSKIPAEDDPDAMDPSNSGQKTSIEPMGSTGTDPILNNPDVPKKDPISNPDPIQPITDKPTPPKPDPIPMPPKPDPIPIPPKPDPIPTPPKPVPASTTPKNCEGESTVSDKDLVIFDGKLVSAVDNKVSLNSDWILNETWDNARLGVEMKNDQSVITFSNEGIYHGFKITPQGQMKRFVASGVDIYVSSSKDSSTFGLRIIKPDEFEGNGGASSTSWYKTSPDSQEPDSRAGKPSLSQTCKLVKFYITPSFTRENKVSTRLIWEMMTDWSPNDKLYLHKIVLKDFSWK
jgi:hypothetical protein